MKKVIAALALSVASFQAHAWGSVEQAALAAIAGGFIIGRATAQPTLPPPPVYYSYSPPYSYNTYPQYSPQYYARPILKCSTYPIYNHFGQIVRFGQVCTY